MPKQTHQLVLMLFVGILIGTALMLISDSRNGEVRDAYTTTQGATTSDADAFIEARPLPELFSVRVASPQIPKNERIGLTVRDQFRGDTVFASDLHISGTKWVVIYDDREGKPGWILGAARVREGDKEAAVSLLRPEGTLAGATYYAAILDDDGDGEFNRLADLPPLTPDKVIIVSFEVL